jgi:hypothetical protein
MQRSEALHALSRGTIALLLLGGVSCSGGGPAALNPVKGKLLYKDQPIGGAVVSFHPTGGGDALAARPVGMTKEDGTFSLTTGQAEGAPAGEYVVTVVWPGEAGGKKKVMSTAPPETVDRLQGAYANRDTSSIKAEVKKGENQLEPFHLK